MKLVLGLMALVALTLPAQAHRRYYATHHLAQGELRQAQNFQPWAWSVERGMSADRHRGRYHHRISHVLKLARREISWHAARAVGLVTIGTAANPITVASDTADRFKSLIADLVANGFKGEVDCYASSGHVHHSLHYTGHACDFAQTGKGRVEPGAGIMYHASDIIAKYGLRDGCSFGDCGHVDTGEAYDRSRLRTVHRSRDRDVRRGIRLGSK